MYRYFLAMRYLLSRPINLLGMIGVTLGVWALILVVSIFSGFLKVFRAHVQSATSDVSVLAIPESASYESTAVLIRGADNVAATAPRLVWYALLHGGGTGRRKTTSMTPGADAPVVTVLGIDPVLESEVTGLRDWLQAIDPETHADLRVTDPDHPLQPIDDVPTILLGKDRMLLHGLRRGDRVRMTTGRPGTGPLTAAQELTGEFVVAGAFATEHIGFDGLHALVSIDAMRELLQTGGRDSVSEISVRLTDPSLGEVTVDEIGRRLRARFGLSSPPVFTWLDLNRQFLQAVEHQRLLMKWVLFVILVVAGVLMFATLIMMVTEKIRDIGILTALGGRPLGVFQVFLFCGLAITAAGIVLGVVFGCLSSVYLDAFNTKLREWFEVDLFPPGVYNLAHVPYELDPGWIALVCGVALGAGFVVSGIPALWAALQSPLRSLRNE